MIASFSGNRLQRSVMGLLVLLSVTGCATTGAGDSRDPLEPLNRGVYSFNKTADELVINHVARGYNFMTPDIVDEGVTNFFSNLGEIANFANNLLQLKIDQALGTATRFVFNSTFGIGGFFDVSSHVGLPEYQEDFGQTLAYWGVGSGPYLVLPLLGPSTVRDTGGIVADSFMNPIAYIDDDEWQYGLVALGFVDVKSDYLSTGGLVSEAALDEYEFVKNAYFERRRSQINDGKESEYEDYEDLDDSVTPAIH